MELSELATLPGYTFIESHLLPYFNEIIFSLNWYIYEYSGETSKRLQARKVSKSRNAYLESSKTK